MFITAITFTVQMENPLSLAALYYNPETQGVIMSCCLEITERLFAHQQIPRMHRSALCRKCFSKVMGRKRRGLTCQRWQ